ncbi:MAG: VCBS repeat-containing protein [Gemmatimonas sp.]|uniref:FG-GAP repeat domain-containing protein n=1 Tax=Gemmatimonas sp. TaxID=1962908 RepID=UPI0025B9A031|nr:VCBS repeat-containing protein [Gemmatimonas sp.]MCA2988530.1 VCBS repeat-containing protein [Gemmatimonas sp.]
MTMLPFGRPGFRPFMALGLCVAASAAVASQTSAPRVFARVLLLETTSETSASVSLGDIDNNGTLDVVLAKGRHWPLVDQILRNDGRGHFSTQPLADSADRTYSAALADLDGDGDLDIVVSNDKPDRKLIYLNDGAGHFRVGGTFGEAAWNTRYVTVADVNGDQRPDLIVANRSANPAVPRPSFVCLNRGAGTFDTCAPLATQSATIVVASDLDGDGKTDLVVPHRDGGQNLIFWNDGTGVFRDPPTPLGPPTSQIRAAAAADINGDRVIDVVVGDERNGLFVYMGAGPRAFDAPVALPSAGGAPYSVAIADMNRDAKPDLVVGRQEAVGSVLFNTGGARVPRFTDTPWGDGKGSVYGVAVGDLDGDGWPDIAAARSEAPNAVWFSGAIQQRTPKRSYQWLQQVSKSGVVR